MFLFLFRYKLKNIINPASEIYNTYASQQKDYEELKYNSDYGCYAKNTRYGNAYCARLLQANGWRIPEDYPYKF